MNQQVKKVKKKTQNHTTKEFTTQKFEIFVDVFNLIIGFEL